MSEPGSFGFAERLVGASSVVEMANTFPVGEPRTTLVEMAQVWRRLADDYADSTEIEGPRTATL
jgi:hypothetical protein